MMKRTAAGVIATVLSAAVLCAGCSSGTDVKAQGNASDVSVLSSAAGDRTSSSVAEPQSAVPEQPQTPAEIKGSGRIAYDDSLEERLSAEQEQILLDYMDLYFHSLADLTVFDPTALFADDRASQALIQKSVWQTVIDVRKAQQTDLAISEFSYILTVSGINENDDGTVSVSVFEDSSQTFSAYGGAVSEAFSVRHRFSLKNTDTRWKLRSHTQMDSANRVAAGSLLYGSYRPGGEGYSRVTEIDSTDIYGTIAQQYDRVLSAHMEALALRALDAEAYNPNAETDLTWSYDYDRDAALAYAQEWVSERNLDVWESYDNSGGNCQNYASQVLFAGGIPRDYTGNYQWKWYGVNVDYSNSARGRSSSWAGVNDFYAYAANNLGGYGLVAEVDANFWTGQPGDLIQLGYEDEWRHVVVIVEVIYDADGNPADYLINSNTADLKNYPLSTYMYPEQRLIRIYGWQG